MDKTREEFENWVEQYYEGWANLKTTENGDYRDMQVHDLWKAYKSRDKEIHRLEQIAIENSDWFDALKIDFDKQKEDFAELKDINKEMHLNFTIYREEIEKLKAFEQIDKQRIEEGLAEIKRLQKALRNIKDLVQLYSDETWCEDDIFSIIKEALEDKDGNELL